MKKLFLKNYCGFTLIELIIVISVLGILILIAFPRINNVTERSREESLNTTAVNLRKSILLHLAEYNYMPNTNDTELDFSKSSIDFNLGESFEVEGLDSFSKSNNSFLIYLYELSSLGKRTGNYAIITENAVSITN